MSVALTTAIFLVFAVAFGSLTVAVLAYGVHDALAAHEVRRIAVCDPWTRLLDDALRRHPEMPRLAEAVSEIKERYATLSRQRRELCLTMATHERMPGVDTQHDYLERQVVAAEAELDTLRVRIRELHALVVVRQIGPPANSVPISDGLLGRMRAEAEVERLAKG